MSVDVIENSKDYADIVYVGDNRPNWKIVNQEGDLYCQVTGKEGVKSYDIYTFLKYSGSYIAFKATKEPKEVKQLDMLLEWRAATIHFIENAKRITEGHELKKEYKYGGFIRSIDSHISMSKAELENKLLTSQIETNASVQTANQNIIQFNTSVVKTNSATKWLLFISIVIAAIGLFSEIYKIVTDDEKERLQNIILSQEKKSTARELQLLKRDYKIDSLEILLLKITADSIN